MPKSGTEKMVKWAYANPKEGLALASVLGPFRNSKKLPIEEVIAQLVREKQHRPIWIWAGAGQKEEFLNRASAIRALKLMRRPVKGDWVKVHKRDRVGIIVNDEGLDDDTFGVLYGNKLGDLEPYLSVDEVKLVEPITDPTRWLHLVKKDGLLLQYACKDVANDFRIAYTAVRQNVDAIQHVESHEVANAVSKKLPKAIDKMSDALRERMLVLR